MRRWSVDIESSGEVRVRLAGGLVFIILNDFCHGYYFKIPYSIPNGVAKALQNKLLDQLELAWFLTNQRIYDPLQLFFPPLVNLAGEQELF